jgi:ketosteroid isomerase-like protein
MKQPLPIQLPHSPQREEQAIRQQRHLFNEAIAAHDTRSISSCWLPDVQVSTSDGRPLVGREEVQQAFEQFFADPTFITFTRTPTQVTISDDGRTAAEFGDWIGLWRRLDENNTRRGTYLASWHKQGRYWLLQAELFVPLGS